MRSIIKDVVERYLDCGNPRYGFARIRCASCGEERLCYFSCRTRGFCPSCQSKLSSNTSRLSLHHLASFQDSLLAQMFAREVFALLLREELISEAMVEKIMGWRHSGFSVHSQVRAKTREEAERVGKYMIRPLLSLKRLFFDDKEGQVCYRYGKEAEEAERMDYLPIRNF